MKKTFVIGGFLSILITFQISAQGLENDDMYFNSKDREKLKAAEAEGVSVSTVEKKKKADESIAEPEVNINPSENYSSARTINPEFIARSNSAQASAEELNYYVEGYGSASNTYDSYSSTNNNSTGSTVDPIGTSNWSSGNTMYNSYSPSPWGYSPYSGCNNPYMMNPYSAGSGWALSRGYY